VTSPLLSSLNPQQREAVTAVNGPLLVIAGAGSGKTRVITHRIAYLIMECNVPAWSIFAATFTNKAAEEMKHRIFALLSLPPRTPLYIATFHSLCATILRREAHKIGLSNRFLICDETDQLALIKDCCKLLKLTPDDVAPQHIQWVINQAKIRMLEPSALSSFAPARQSDLYSQLYALYQHKLRENDAVDFEDLILYVVRLFESDPETLAEYQNRYRYILVDEYQDTNLLQYLLVKALAASHRNICVVGDEDQSIYSWRGAELSNLLDFQKTFPDARLIRLEQNYRSTQNILTAAAHVISNNTQRLGKQLWTEREIGRPLMLIVGSTERDEAMLVVNTIEQLHLEETIPYSHMAIFYRQNSLSRNFEDHLRARNIPYQVIGGIRFYDRAEIKDLIAYLKVVANPNASLSLQRILNKPRRGIGERTLQQVQDFAHAHNLTLNEALRQCCKDSRLPAAAVKRINAFLDQLTQWQDQAQQRDPYELLQTILEDTHYIESLGDQKSLEVVIKTDNIQELQNAVRQYLEENPLATLEDYLEMVSLATHIDDFDEQEEGVALMTLHCAKGLEFRIVFIVGMEEPIFPNRRAIKDTGNMEEERRLFYVGMTRTKDRLFLSRADSRMAFGRVEWNVPSVFLRELPSDLVRETDTDEFQWIKIARNAANAHKKPKHNPGRAKSSGQPSPSSVALGQRVRHPSLGEGTVVSIRGAGDTQIVSIQLDSGQQHDVLMRFGQIEPVP
jgi:DNA helicase-2/ATP-dependent DNA helicase PcrA